MRQRRPTITSALTQASSASSSFTGVPVTTKSALILDQRHQLESMQFDLSRSISLLTEANNRIDSLERFGSVFFEFLFSCFSSRQSIAAEMMSEFLHLSELRVRILMHTFREEQQENKLGFANELENLVEEFGIKEQKTLQKVRQLEFAAESAAYRLFAIPTRSQSMQTAEAQVLNQSTQAVTSAASVACQIDSAPSDATIRELMTLEKQRSNQIENMVKRIEEFESIAVPSPPAAKEFSEAATNTAAVESPRPQLPKQFVSCESQTAADTLVLQKANISPQVISLLPELVKFFSHVSSTILELHAFVARTFVAEPAFRSISKTTNRATWCGATTSVDTLHDDPSVDHMNPAKQLDRAIVEMEKLRGESRRLHYEISRLIAAKQIHLMQIETLGKEKETLRRSFRAELNSTSHLRDFVSSVELELLSSVPQVRGISSPTKSGVTPVKKTALEQILGDSSPSLNYRRGPPSGSGDDTLHSVSKETLIQTIHEERKIFEGQLAAAASSAVTDKWSTKLELGGALIIDESEASLLTMSPAPTSSTAAAPPTAGEYYTATHLYKSLLHESCRSLQKLPNCFAALQAIVSAIVCVDELKVPPSGKIVVCSRYYRQQLEQVMETVKAAVVSSGISLKSRVPEEELRTPIKIKKVNIVAR